MEIVQVRAGFATNSSSSHSLIYLPGGASDNDAANCDQDFGWEWFTLGSREAKARYAAQSFKNILSDAILIKHLGVAPDPDGYIDHQSVDLLGWVRNEDDLIKFVRLYLDNENVVITGGNDNEGGEGLVPSGQPILRFSSTVQWRDGDNFVVIFDPASGNKTHLSKFGAAIGQVPADFPELVDLKISDYCSFGCSFCYQNSTRRGKHGDLKYIKSVIDQLALLGTLEIAIGGGEPMQYPYLKEVLQYAYERNVMPNFTTRDYHGLANIEDFQQYVGGVAVSVSSLADVEEVLPVLPTLSTTTLAKLTFQIPVGAQTYLEFNEMIERIATSEVPICRITLLGYKQVGRGTASKYHSFENLLVNTFFEDRTFGRNNEHTYKAARYPRLSIGVDTQLVQLAPEFINVLPDYVRDKVVMRQEGLHSCYIDAVTKRIAPSSYCSEDLYQSFEINEIGDIFYEISTTACEILVHSASIAGNAGSIAVQNVD